MVEIPSPGLWGDPRVWLISSVVLIILTIVLIYYKVLTAEKGP